MVTKSLIERLSRIPLTAEMSAGPATRVHVVVTPEQDAAGKDKWERSDGLERRKVLAKAGFAAGRWVAELSKSPWERLSQSAKVKVGAVLTPHLYSAAEIEATKKKEAPMFDGSIRSLQVALMAALDQAERLHAEVSRAPLRVQQTVGRQLEEVTIPMLHRLLDQEDAFGGIPTLRRTAGALDGTSGADGMVAMVSKSKRLIGQLVDEAAQAEVKPLTAKDEEEAADEEQAFLLA